MKNVASLIDELSKWLTFLGHTDIYTYLAIIFLVAFL